MKKINIKIIILIIIGLIIIGIGVAILLWFTPSKKEENPDNPNSYNFSKDVVEIPGTIEYTNDKLTTQHCLDNICVENVKFYYKDNNGRIEYEIFNKGKKEVSGYLKLVFKDKEFTINYKKLAPNTKKISRVEYMNIEIDNKSDYILRDLTKEELSQIKR